MGGGEPPRVPDLTVTVEEADAAAEDEETDEPAPVVADGVALPALPLEPPPTVNLVQSS